MNRANATLAWPRASRSVRQPGTHDDSSENQRLIARVILLNSASVVKAQCFSTAC
jgi:hypothetical protein